jgi:hypothetical protein
LEFELKTFQKLGLFASLGDKEKSRLPTHLDFTGQANLSHWVGATAIIAIFGKAWSSLSFT